MEKHVTQRLDEMRGRSGLTVDELARRMGYKTASGVQRYLSPESYKKAYFSLDVARKIDRALTGMGLPPITRQEVYALAGVEPPPPATSPGDGINPHALAVEMVDRMSAITGNADPQLKSKAIWEIMEALTRLQGGA